MTKILIPASKPEDWQLPAKSHKHWKTGHSARALAYCWQEAGGIPPEILEVLNQVPTLKGLKTIFAIPEHKVPLPSRGKASQNDVWVLAETESNLISIAVEGKVSESFGKTVKDWFKTKTKGKEKRLRYLCGELGLKFPPQPKVRYQLLHRTVSAIIEAKRFRTTEAVMVVHTFSKTNKWLADYQYFLSLLNLSSGIDEAVTKNIKGINLTFAWVHGPEKYLKA